MPRLRCSCQDCGAHAKIAVLMPRLRCSCWDWGAQVTSILAWAPQSRHEHLKLGMSSWAPQSNHSNYLCIWGRHHQLDYLTRPRKSSWATNCLWWTSLFSAFIKLKSESGNQSISPLCVAKLPNVLCCREEHKRKDYLIREAAEAIRFRPVTQSEGGCVLVCRVGNVDSKIWKVV